MRFAARRAECPDFDKFDRKRYPKGLKFVGMIQYDGDLKLKVPERYLVPPPSISKTPEGGARVC